jgi:hypothetical protein
LNADWRPAQPEGMWRGSGHLSGVRVMRKLLVGLVHVAALVVAALIGGTTPWLEASSKPIRSAYDGRPQGYEFECPSRSAGHAVPQVAVIRGSTNWVTSGVNGKAI